MNYLLMAGMLSMPLVFGSCSDDESVSSGITNTTTDPKIEAAFAFNTTKDMMVDITMPAFAKVNVYDQLPEEGVDAKLLFTTYTGANGRFKGSTALPTSYIGKTVYVVAQGAGCPAAIEAKVTETGLKVVARASKAVDRVDNVYNDQEISDIQAGVLKALPEAKDNYEYVNEHYTVYNNIDLKVKLKEGEEAATLDVTFVNAEGWNDNTLYYYYYEKGQSVNIYDFINEEHRVFGPYSRHHATDESFTNEAMGYTVRLKKNGDEKFKNGDMVGFILSSKAYDTGRVENFSTRQNDPQSARFVYKQKALVYTFEDQSIFKGGKRQPADFNDFTFMVTASPIDAIDDPNIPDLPEPPFFLYVTDTVKYEGTVLFEDMFPSAGDYDMNDFVVSYTLVPETAVKYDPAIQDEVPPYYLSKLNYEFTPVWDGAAYGCDLYFKLDGTDKAPVWIYTLPVDGIKGQLDEEPISGVVDLNFRVSVDKDTKAETYAGGGVELGNEPVVSWETMFNPYIKVQDTGYEVHLAKKPSTVFYSDLTPWLQNYLLDENSNFPFAMNIPIKDYKVVTERVRIDKFYPQYTEWVESNGASATDWYLYPAE